MLKKLGLGAAAARRGRHGGKGRLPSKLTVKRNHQKRSKLSNKDLYILTNKVKQKLIAGLSRSCYVNLITELLHGKPEK